MLARAAAAEIGARDQEFRPLEARLIEDELGVLAPLQVIAPAGEQPLAEPRPARRDRLGLRNDRIRIDIGPQQRRRDALFDRKFLHHRFRASSTERSGYAREPGNPARAEFPRIYARS